MPIPLSIRELAGCGIAVAAGLVFMAIGGASSHFIIVNIMALVAVAVSVWIVPPTVMDKAPLMLTIIVAVLMAATLVSGVAIDEVRRWLPVGPLRLHAGMLLLPAFIVVIQRIEPRFALAAVVAVTIIIGVQPDFASALALSLSTFTLALMLRQIWAYIAAAIAIAMLAVSIFGMVDLPPVAFVEDIATDAWAIHPALAIILGASLSAAIFWPLRLWKFLDQAHVTERIAFVACIAGFAIASLFGPYPVPMLGYGASSILGYSLGVALFASTSGPQPDGIIKEED